MGAGLIAFALVGPAACSDPHPFDAGGDALDATRSPDVEPTPDATTLDAMNLDATPTDAMTTDATPTDATPADATDGSPSDARTDDAATDAPDDAAPDGSVDVGTARLIAPMSTSTASSRRPTLRWALGGGADGARVEVCSDRACAHVITTLHGTTSAAPSSDLPAGVVFWRAFATRGATESAAPSATWEFRVRARSAPVDTSSGTFLDVNGDGYADVVIGAPNGSSGSASVYLGSATGLSSTPASVYSTGVAFDGFGGAVASAGDVNGDGYGDLIVGAYGTDNGGLQDNGSASVYLGGPTGLTATAAVVLTGAAAYDEFGASVAGVGDIDGDGYGDVVVGAVNAEHGTAEPGSASVFRGSAAGPSTTPAVVLLGTGDLEEFGAVVAAAGDVNGDGFADVIVGAPDAEHSGVSYGGAASVYLGSAAGLATSPVLAIDGTDVDGNLGAGVAGAGDVDGDGYDDVLVGEPGTSPAAGAARLYRGGPSGPASTPAVVFAGVASGDGFGALVASAGDLNGDGHDDVVIGAPGATSAGRADAGTVSLYLGSAAGLATTPTQVITGTVPGGFLGAGGAGGGVGDIDGDGYDDMVLGEFHADAGGITEVGLAGVYPGSAAGPPADPVLVLMGTHYMADFGGAIARAERVGRTRRA